MSIGRVNEMTDSGQMTIWDYLNGLDNLPEDEMVRKVGEGSGLDFKPAELKGKWSDMLFYQAKDKGAVYEIHYSAYMGTSIRFISVGWGYKASGGGAPCDSVEEAIKYLKRYKEQVAKEKGRMKNGT